jgi:hypothetical protein
MKAPKISYQTRTCVGLEKNPLILGSRAFQTGWYDDDFDALPGGNRPTTPIPPFDHNFFYQHKKYSCSF